MALSEKSGDHQNDDSSSSWWRHGSARFHGNPSDSCWAISLRNVNPLMTEEGKSGESPKSVGFIVSESRMSVQSFVTVHLTLKLSRLLVVSTNTNEIPWCSVLNSTSPQKQKTIDAGAQCIHTRTHTTETDSPWILCTDPDASLSLSCFSLSF